jgi:hypothetical protein
MAVFTTLRFADSFGVNLTEVATYGTPDASGGGGAALDVTLNCSPGASGVLECTLPLSFNPSFLLEDGRIGVRRAINGRPPYLDNGAIFQIRYIDYGPQSIFVRAYHATNLLDRRIIAYPAGSAFCTKAAAPADDQIKTFVNENMLAGIVGASRDGVETYADVSAYLTKQANLGLGASIAKSAARRRLLDVATDLANASTTAGTYLTFEIIAPTESTLELRTYAIQRGVDRRAGTANPVILSSLRGNLTDAHLVFDYTSAASFVVAGGQGEQTERLIGTAFDATRAGGSPFGRIERFRDATNVAAQAAVDDEADTQLRAARPLILFTGELVETPGLTRGIDFDLGDMVTAEHPQSGQQFDVRLDMIRETIGTGGRRVACGLRSIEPRVT